MNAPRPPRPGQWPPAPASCSGERSSSTARIWRARRPDTLIWHGRVAGQPGGFAILTLVHDVLIGHIVTQIGYKTEFYEIRYRGHGVHALVQLDQSRFAKDRLTADEPEVMTKKKMRRTPSPAADANDVPTPTCKSDPASDIDLLALYTPAAV